MRARNWDIFCNVVDNLGDIGVCWRLARQLATEYGLAVRLWVDDLHCLEQLCAEIQVSAEEQVRCGVVVRRWVTPFPQTKPADVVIEAFACDLPDTYVAAMAARPVSPVWINLEYLSAEDWVEDCHGLSSPHPRLALNKYFYFPGFVAASGGLLRESQLIRQRDAWQAEPSAGWSHLGLPPPEPLEASISMFCYENPAIPQLLHAWVDGDTRLRCLIPEGKALREVAAALGNAAFRVGDRVTLGQLTLYALPFLSPENYDRLLWSCDLNFVRGEDSFVRAQWAAQPLIWHIYPQGDFAHIAKLEAFLARYCKGLPSQVSEECRNFWLAWNRGDAGAVTTAWPAFWRVQAELREHAALWSGQLCGQVDLARQLVLFCEKVGIIAD